MNGELHVNELAISRSNPVPSISNFLLNLLSVDSAL